MGQQNNKYIQYIDKASDIVISDPKLDIKQSTAKYGGNGVFAEEFIPKGTIFCKSDPFNIIEETIGRYINDLLYQGNAEEYEQNESTNNVTNIGYVKTNEESSPFDLFGMKQTNKTCHCITLVDIMKGQELSRYYGADYWFDYEFKQKYKLFIEKKEYPPDYIFLDEYRTDLDIRFCINVYVKCVDSKYYYVYGHGVSKNYYTRINAFQSLPIFRNILEVNNYVENKFGKYETMDDQTKKEYYEFKFLMDCSKPDYRK